MTIRRLVHSLPVSHAILWTAAVLVPSARRAEWLAEWRAELWHVWNCVRDESATATREHGDAEVTAFCMGAFHDAVWMRRNEGRSTMRRRFQIGSPWRCGATLIVLALASMLLCCWLPGAHKAMLPLPRHAADGVVMISSEGYDAGRTPTIRLEDYESWRTSARHLFTGIAFYQPIHRQVRIARHRTAELSLARATSNLFDVLRLPLSAEPHAATMRPHMARVILSRQAWRRYFNSNPQVAGRTLVLAGQQAQIAGVAPEGAWQLPDGIDAWILEDQKTLDALPASARGFVLAQIKASGFPAGGTGQRSMTVSRENGEADRYDCVSLAQHMEHPFFLFLFTLFLACLALPATTPLPLGEYSVRGSQLSLLLTIRRWLFLAAKISLILPVVYFSSLDLAYGRLPLDSTTAQYIQMAASFAGLLFGLRWALKDQRRRCPVCLRLLTNPARVGHASRNFLAWNGTELICGVGHGMLHIPEIPTSWCSTQRWFYLDSSWSSLFSDTYLAPAGTS